MLALTEFLWPFLVFSASTTTPWRKVLFEVAKASMGALSVFCTADSEENKVLQTFSRVRISAKSSPMLVNPSHSLHDAVSGCSLIPAAIFTMQSFIVIHSHMFQTSVCVQHSYSYTLLNMLLVCVRVCV